MSVHDQLVICEVARCRMSSSRVRQGASPCPIRATFAAVRTRDRQRVEQPENRRPQRIRVPAPSLSRGSNAIFRVQNVRFPCPTDFDPDLSNARLRGAVIDVVFVNVTAARKSRLCLSIFARMCVCVCCSRRSAEAHIVLTAISTPWRQSYHFRTLPSLLHHRNASPISRQTSSKAFFPSPTWQPRWPFRKDGSSLWDASSTGASNRSGSDGNAVRV